MRIVDHGNLAVERGQHVLRQRNGEGLRLAAGQIHQNVGDGGWLCLSLGSGDPVGVVFTVGHLAGETVRSLVRDRIDSRAADILLLQRIGMQRDEERGVILPGDRHAFGKGEILILVARQKRLDTGLRVQLAGENLRESQRDILFLGRAVGAGRTGVDAAVTGIDRHEERIRIGLLRRLDWTDILGGIGGRPALLLHQRCKLLGRQHFGVEHKTMPLAALIGLRFGHDQFHRLLGRQHNAGAVGVHGAVADILEETGRLEIGSRKAECGCRKIDDDTDGIVEIVHREGRLAIHVYDDARTGIIARYARAIGKQGIGGGSRPGWRKCYQHRQGEGRRRKSQSLHATLHRMQQSL
ncbi:hypothetical protein RHSP_15790 [Rhizobium freirei PRF 81]|uniref:Uncharacterized protein n=1 Tax=Rhizobium freirei PRF 81 TaxID=363754 RepID=N6UWD5_9HYPH|nr:hypothetical protein RHSP_15790 [Rhizobium freirei PRF 81]